MYSCILAEVSLGVVLSKLLRQVLDLHIRFKSTTMESVDILWIRHLEPENISLP
jgi:hypothetical protein